MTDRRVHVTAADGGAARRVERQRARGLATSPACAVPRSSTCSCCSRCRWLMVFYRTFEDGIGAGAHGARATGFQHAFWLTLLITAIAVPINTIFGVIAALAMVRREFPGRCS